MDLSREGLEILNEVCLLAKLEAELDLEPSFELGLWLEKLMALKRLSLAKVLCC